MFAQIRELLAQLLASPAMAAEIANYQQDFVTSEALQIEDVNAASYTLTLEHAVAVTGFEQVFEMQPTRKGFAGPFPSAYIYHTESEYIPQQQQANLVCGRHTFAVSILAGGATPDESEATAALLAICASRVIGRNQYIFGQLPRAAGASTLANVPKVTAGVNGPSAVASYHLLVTVQVYEYRY